jgi:23S rRNA pseudouridine1911/1915/1917 synthase
MTDEASETIGSVTIQPDEAGGRLDRVLAARIPSLSRSRLKALILDGQVTVDGRTILDPSADVKSGEVVHVNLPPPEEAVPRGEAIPLDIIYEDDQLIVINKPKDLVVHPSAGHANGTLVNALIAHCGDSLSGIGGVKRPGIVHRLDKDTTGLMVVAKNDRSKGTIDAPLDRSAINREKQAVREGGRDAITHWEMRERYDAHEGKEAGKPIASLLACMLETGRTHQIRVHLAHIGHPIMGDETYATGFKTKGTRLSPPARDALEALGRQALHAAVLGFEHPMTHEHLRFEAPLPPDMARLVEALRAG